MSDVTWVALGIVACIVLTAIGLWGLVKLADRWAASDE